MGRYTADLISGPEHRAAIDSLSTGDAVTLHPEPGDAGGLRAAAADGATIGHLDRESWLVKAVLDHQITIRAGVDSLQDGRVVLKVLTESDAAPGATPAPAPANKAGCLRIVGYSAAALFGLAIVGAVLGPADKGKPAGSEEKAAQDAPAEPDHAAIEEQENRRKGFHCLSPWDGAHRQLVEALKKTLRDPDSFAHDETRITPANDKGLHLLTMRYRARNGFGGMNVGTITATVKNSDCTVTIVSMSDG